MACSVDRWLRRPDHSSGSQQGSEFLGRLGTAKQEALDSIASQIRERSYLTRGLRTFRNGTESEAMSQSDDGADNCFILLMKPETCDKGRIDLKKVHGNGR